jgi:hypothetical protein
MLGCQIRFYLIRLEKCSGLGSRGGLHCRFSRYRHPEEQFKESALMDDHIARRFTDIRITIDNRNTGLAS